MDGGFILSGVDHLPAALVGARQLQVALVHSLVLGQLLLLHAVPFFDCAGLFTPQPFERVDVQIRS